MGRTGFTLIELLVVIAVIAMLTGVLLSVLHPARQQSQAIVCASNLKQLALALIAYDQENGTFPYGFVELTLTMVAPHGGYVGNPAYDEQGWWWFHFLASSLGENFDRGAVVWCPSRSIQDSGLRPNVLCGNYGVNQAICKNAKREINSLFSGTPLGVYRIRPPDATLLIADSGYSLISWRGATNAPIQRFDNARREGSYYVPALGINEERILFPGCEQDAIDGRHPNKSVNVGFADGHISRAKVDYLFVEENDGDYINRSPLWVPR